MITYPPDARFRYPWRSYQQRVLNELQQHLSDNHLHVVAPPGSGKTILGLEIARQLNKPTLILAPTITIRNQWIQRFCELFLQTHETPDWISRDIRNPGFLTVSTYQGLHAACNNMQTDEAVLSEEEDESTAETTKVSKDLHLDPIVALLQERQVKTIVIDEAHHLTNSWWHTLSKVKGKLDPTIVGLTATPPYDVSFYEWQRYIELNGPVDAEISVPELVFEGDLCPHQDYVYFTAPAKEEHEWLIGYRERVHRIFQEIKQDDYLIATIENHPIWTDPIAHLEWIYTNLPCYSASLIFLKAAGRPIPQTHLEVIGENAPVIPELDLSWLQTLLEFYLFQENEYFLQHEEHRQRLINSSC